MTKTEILTAIHEINCAFAIRMIDDDKYRPHLEALTDLVYSTIPRYKTETK